MSLKSFVPISVKTKIRLLQRVLTDRITGTSSKFAKKGGGAVEFPFSISLSQPIMQSHLFENKLSNIKLSCEKINQLMIGPGEVFSFWEAIGAPNSQNGFKVGRNIISGKLSEAIGGGLCQTSSIVYHLSLITGLTIIERYNHTIDIYTDETRFTPLGADATVVYGHKDLRIFNQYGFAVKFFLEINGNRLTASLWSEKHIGENEVSFIKRDLKIGTEMDTVNQEKDVLAISFYKKPTTS